MLSTRTAAVTVATAALVLTGGAATAASKSHRDVAGDAPDAAADITRVVVKNGEKTLMVRTKLAKAAPGRTHLVLTLTPSAEGAATYVLRTVENGRKAGVTLESTSPDATEATVLECRGAKATLSRGRRGQVLVRVPQACFGADAGTLLVQVATQTSAQVGTETEAEVESGVEDTADEVAPLRVRQG